MLFSPAGHLRGCRYGGLAWREAPLAQMSDVLRCHECVCSPLDRDSTALPAVPQLSRAASFHTAAAEFTHAPCRAPSRRYAYLDRVRVLCEKLEDADGDGADDDGGGESPSARAIRMRLESAPRAPRKASVDCDTEVTRHSYAAAMRGAGAVVEAVRAVCGGPREARTAFCAIRPPGHHAGPSGAVGGQVRAVSTLEALGWSPQVPPRVPFDRTTPLDLASDRVPHRPSSACSRRASASSPTPPSPRPTRSPSTARPCAASPSSTLTSITVMARRRACRCDGLLE